MRIKLHVDDFGLTRGMTDSILQTLDEAPVTGVSLIPNGYAFEFAVSELKKKTPPAH